MVVGNRIGRFALWTLERNGKEVHFDNAIAFFTQTGEVAGRHEVGHPAANLDSRLQAALASRRNG
jgi:hypothetical protein